MKKLLSIILTVLILACACTPVALAEGPIELVIWSGTPGENGPQALVDRFNESQSDIHVTYYRFVNDDTGNTKLDTALLSGEQIDLFSTYTTANLIRRSNGGMMADLEALGAKEYIEENLVEGALQYYNGKLVAIPTNYEPQFMYLNKDMFDAAGIEIPQSWSFEDYAEVAKKLTTDEVYGAYAFGFDHTLNSIAVGKDFQYNEDGTGSGWSNPVLKENVQLVYDMTFTDKSAYPYGEILSLGQEVYWQDLMIQEKVAMVESSFWSLRYFKNLEEYPHDFVVGFAPMPTAGKGFNNGALNNWLSISENCTNKEAAFTFLKFWLDGGYDSLYTAGKTPVVNHGVDQDALVAGLLGPDAEQLFDIDSFMYVFGEVAPFDTQDYTTALPEIEQIKQEMNDELYLGAISVDEFIATLDQRTDDIIKAAQ